MAVFLGAVSSTVTVIDCKHDRGLMLRILLWRYRSHHAPNNGYVDAKTKA